MSEADNSGKSSGFVAEAVNPSEGFELMSAVFLNVFILSLFCETEERKHAEYF